MKEGISQDPLCLKSLVISLVEQRTSKNCYPTHICIGQFSGCVHKDRFITLNSLKDKLIVNSVIFSNSLLKPQCTASFN